MKKTISLILALMLCAERHSGGGRKSEAERAGRHITAGRMLHIGMSLQIAVYAAELFKFFLRNESALRQYRVKRRSGVTF